jgi:glycosyltransferase involved in cell wall biosynthesis
MASSGAIRVANILEEGRFGGPGRRVASVAGVLAARGIETIVVLPDRDSDVLSSRLAEAGVESRPVALTRLSLHPATLLRYTLRFPFEVLLLRRTLRDLAPDLVHVNGSYQFKAAIAARLAGARVVWHLNDTMMPWPVRVAFRLTAGVCADAFVVAGQRVRDYYLDEGLERTRPVREIHAPVDPERFVPADRDTSDSRVPLVVGTVANVNPTKGLEHFVRAASRLHRTHPRVRFRIAGAELQSQRRYSRRLREAAARAGLLDGTLEFVGAVDDVPAFLNACDVCVFTSLAEASPTAVWEAMACGRPVVTTDVGSVSRHVDDGVSGFVVPVGDADAIAARVGQVLDDSDLRDRLGRAARLHAVEALSLDRAAELHREFYLEVAGPRSQ